MKVCGFTFIRNGIKLDFPFKEAIRSILSLCDEVIVAVGKSDDNTLEVVKAISPKVKVLETVWDESVKSGGKVLALETDKAFQAIPDFYDWAFYIQGDEAVHEKYLPVIKKAMEENLDKKNIDGLLFNYTHFFGSYDYVGTKYSWYRHEIRVVRNNKNIYSYRDAQGFRKDNNKKLRVKPIDAWIYHYGWARIPKAMQEKINSSSKLYHGENFGEISYEYNEVHEPVKKFEGTHPEVMHERIAQRNWNFVPDTKRRYTSKKDWLKHKVAALTGWIPGEYRNYKIVK